VLLCYPSAFIPACPKLEEHCDHKVSNRCLGAYRLGFELGHCALMLAAVILLMYYLFQLTPNLRFSTA
jgi:hypothetical protein